MKSSQPQRDIFLPVNSPIEKVEHPSCHVAGIALYVKRDDRIHPFISGNKWRKLKHILHRAAGEGRRHLVTFGGAWSNHLLATACAGAQFGFRTTGFVRGEPVENPVLDQCRQFGMELQFTDRSSYRDKPRLYSQYAQHAANTFFIDEGGASSEGVQGCAEIIPELTGTYDHLFCACGTGTTLAGLALGLAGIPSAPQLHGVPVLKGGTFIREAVYSLAPAAAPFTLHTDYHFGGYARTNLALRDFIQQFNAATGIPIEPVYTGKVFYALFDLIRQGYFPHGSRVLVLHTGGVYAWPAPAG